MLSLTTKVTKIAKVTKGFVVFALIVRFVVQNDLGIPRTCSPIYERIKFVEIGAI